MNDRDFLAALENCTLPPEEFDHAGHVRAAYLYLNASEFEQALSSMSRAIRAYALHLGKPEKYHVTVTVACMALIAEHIARRGHAGGWPAFRRANPELFAPDLLGRYYDTARLHSDTARTTFLLPEHAAPATG